MDFLRNFDGKKIPWWAIALGFVFVSPVGVILLLLKLFAGDRQSTALNEPDLQMVALPVERVDTRINKPNKPKYADARDASRAANASGGAAKPKKIKTGNTKFMRDPARITSIREATGLELKPLSVSSGSSGSMPAILL